MPVEQNQNYQFPCIVAKQGKYKLVCFVVKAKTLWEFVSINKRDSDKDKGYQRSLSPSRINTIVKFIDRGNSIPNSILIALEKDAHILDGNIIIPKNKEAGWVIDGQHRLAGAINSKTDVEFVIISFIGLSLSEQINQFVTINREAKGVPTSLYYDLLKRLPPNKSDADISKERAADIADILKKNSESPFYQKIVVSPPKSGEISLTNFVRKISPLVAKKGFFHGYPLNDQVGIFDNYYRALMNIFPEYFQTGSQLFFKTLTFGAMINALTTVFNLTYREYAGFRVEDISKILRRVEDFSFKDWEKSGTGSQAELQAGEDFYQTLLTRSENTKPEGGLLRLS